MNDWHMAASPAVLCALAVGGLVGLANGLLVVFVGLNAFIATLATMTVYSALALAFTQSAVIVMNPTSLTGLVTRQLLGIPAGVYGTWILTAIVWYMLEWTVLGRHIRACGSAREAARLAGVKVRNIRLFSFSVSGLFAGLGGVLLAGLDWLGRSEQQQSVPAPRLCGGFPRHCDRQGGQVQRAGIGHRHIRGDRRVNGAATGGAIVMDRTDGSGRYAPIRPGHGPIYFTVAAVSGGTQCLSQA